MHRVRFVAETEADRKAEERQQQPAFQAAFKRLQQQPSPGKGRPNSAAAATGTDSAEPNAAAQAAQEDASSSTKSTAAFAQSDRSVTSAAASAAGTATAAQTRKIDAESSNRVAAPRAALAAAEGRLHSAMGSHAMAEAVTTASATSGAIFGAISIPQGPQIAAVASAVEAGNGAGRMPQPTPAATDQALTGSQPSLRRTMPASHSAAERDASEPQATTPAAPGLPHQAVAGLLSAEKLPADPAVAPAVVRAEVSAAPDQARGAGTAPKQVATDLAVVRNVPTLAREGHKPAVVLEPSQQQRSATAVANAPGGAPDQAQATMAASKQPVAPVPDQELRSARSRHSDIPRTAQRPPVLAGSLSNADEMASDSDVVIGSVPSRHPRQKLDFGDRSAAVRILTLLLPFQENKSDRCALIACSMSNVLRGHSDHVSREGPVDLVSLPASILTLTRQGEVHSTIVTL